MKLWCAVVCGSISVAVGQAEGAERTASFQADAPRRAVRATAQSGLGIWKRLHRHLHVAHFASADECPSEPTVAAAEFGTGYGHGPIYLVGVGQHLAFEMTTQWHGWYPAKGWWVASPGFSGPVLIRGRRADRVGPVRFSANAGTVGVSELRLQFVPAARDWHTNQARRYIQVRTAGCYGLQADGIGFSRVVYFRAIAGGG